MLRHMIQSYSTYNRIDLDSLYLVDTATVLDGSFGKLFIMCMTPSVLITPWYSGNSPRVLEEELIPMPDQSEGGLVFSRDAYSGLMG